MTMLYVTIVVLSYKYYSKVLVSMEIVSIVSMACVEKRRKHYFLYWLEIISI